MTTTATRSQLASTLEDLGTFDEDQVAIVRDLFTESPETNGSTPISVILTHLATAGNEPLVVVGKTGTSYRVQRPHKHLTVDDQVVLGWEGGLKPILLDTNRSMIFTVVRQETK